VPALFDVDAKNGPKRVIKWEEYMSLLERRGGQVSILLTSNPINDLDLLLPKLTLRRKLNHRIYLSEQY
jgi:hypothetical protein